MDELVVRDASSVGGVAGLMLGPAEWTRRRAGASIRIHRASPVGAADDVKTGLLAAHRVPGSEHVGHETICQGIYFGGDRGRTHVSPGFARPGSRNSRPVHVAIIPAVPDLSMQTYHDLSPLATRIQGCGGLRRRDQRTGSAFT